MEALSAMVNSGFSMIDHVGNPHPIIAEDVPSIENGLWKIESNGRMTTTWKIRPGALWHDGEPVTADDVAFSFQLGKDKGLGIFARPEFELIGALDTPDSHTVVAHWTQSFVYANLLFGYANDNSTLPLPKHLLETSYKQADLESFLALPYWTTEMVGEGPYRLKGWDLGTRASFTANDSFVLGRPKIDDIDVLFITDTSTLMSNLLSGAVQVNLGRGFSFEQGAAAQEQGLKVDFAAMGAYALFPQFVDTKPQIILNPDFRRALMYGMDRQSLVDTFSGGRSTIANTFIFPDEYDYKDIETAAVKYPFDPTRSGKMLEGIGLTKSGDGAYRDAAGAVRVEIRTSANNGSDKVALAVVDMWKSVGVGVDFVVPPPQLSQDIEWSSNYPGFQHVVRGNFRWDLKRVLSSAQAPLASNKYNGGNRGRYMNPELDKILDHYQVAIANDDHVQTLRQVVHQVSDELIWMGLFYAADATVSDSHLQNVHGKWERSTQAWNIWEWDLV